MLRAPGTLFVRSGGPSRPPNQPPQPGPKGRQGLAGKTIAGQGTGGKGKGARGIGIATKFAGAKRHRKIMKDNILAITQGNIRRMARRGGVKRISKPIYGETRKVLKDKLTEILQDCVAVADHSQRKTITVSDVIFVLRRQGRPIWGFDTMATSKSTAI